jgi:polysaccharide export outer membrane protein
MVACDPRGIVKLVGRIGRSHFGRLCLVAGLCLGAWQGANAQGTSGLAGALRPGDKIQVKIRREPDLSGEYEVAQDGTVRFPKVGDVEVNQMSTDSLRTFLTARYALSLRDPFVEVTALRRVTISGAVRNPGFQYVDQTITVAGAVALAGGATPDGDQKKVELTRDGQIIPIKLADRHSMADSTLRSGDLVRVPERSWLSRNTALVASGLTGVALIIAAIIRP